jgi:hypothetical protein
MNSMAFDESALDEYVTIEFQLRDVVYLANILMMYVKSDGIDEASEILEIYNIIFQSIAEYGSVTEEI